MTKKRLSQACQEFINSYYGKHGKTNYSYYDKWEKGTYGIDEYYTGIKGNTITIVLQGTNEKNEWWDKDKGNMNFFTKRFKLPGDHFGSNKKIKCHQGFLEAYKTGRQKLLNLAKNYKKIIIVGHSRGAGIGTIFANESCDEVGT